MYELEYVRKRKRRIWVLIAGGISLSVVVSLSIIAFLGRFVGTFTVSLETRNVEIALCNKKVAGDSSTFIRVDSLWPFQEFTYSDFERRFGDDVIDSEETDYTLGANQDAEGKYDSLNFFKTTFYVKNVGTTPAKYDFKLNIADNVLSEDGRSLIDTMRVMVYEDGKKTVYGKGETIPHKNAVSGEADYRAPVSVRESEATESEPFMGYAETFASSKVVTTFQRLTINVGEAKRYTIVSWLEGFRSSSTEPAPKGATIKLGVEINAYENE
ncbi:MAG: hypothetical protein K6C32_03830 [Bacilli bacterium]|nr:hypothetical protein [Bacilli bacterium]